MDSSEKKQLSEIDICDLFITPSIKAAGWNQLTQIRREVTLTPGPVIVRGNMSSRNKKKKKFADYVLQWEASVPIPSPFLAEFTNNGSLLIGTNRGHSKPIATLLPPLIDDDICLANNSISAPNRISFRSGVSAAQPNFFALIEPTSAQNIEMFSMSLRNLGVKHQNKLMP
jgi:type I restriction enzyme R subunit